jgi:ABC-2 type transport system ATP-binding protein
VRCKQWGCSVGARHRRLVDHGVTARVDGTSVLVDLPNAEPYDVVRDTVDELGLSLLRLEQRRHRLEDLFSGAGGGAGEGSTDRATDDAA